MFNLHLGQGIEFGTDLDIDFGLPGLELDINGSPKITAGWDLYFGFGVSVTDFFFLDAAPPEEFTMNRTASSSRAIPSSTNCRSASRSC